MKSFVVVGSMGAVRAEVVVGAVVGSTLLQSVNLISSIPKTDFLKTLNENYLLRAQILNQAAVLIQRYDFDQNLIEVEKIQISLKFRSFSYYIIKNHHLGS